MRYYLNTCLGSEAYLKEYIMSDYKISFMVLSTAF